MTMPDDAGPDLPRISAKQERVLAVIRAWIEQYGYPPTVREIGRAVGLGSPSSVAHHLKALQRHGLLRRDAHAPRAVDIRGARAGNASSEGHEPGVKVPLLGAIAAGTPVLAEQLV